MIRDLDMDGDDLHIDAQYDDAQYDDPNSADAVLISAAESRKTYMSIISGSTI